AEDEVEAKKQFQLFCLHAFVQSEESAVASSLLDAFEQGDQELLEKTVHRQIITFLDNDIVKLARGLQVPGGISHMPPQRFPSEELGLKNDNNVVYAYDQQQSISNSSYGQEKNNYVSDDVNSPKQLPPEFNENRHEEHDNGREKLDSIYDDYVSSYLNENDDELRSPERHPESSVPDSLTPSNVEQEEDADESLC
ncbi:13375_t:CDS:2, partial [Acaulospora morrowiae]